MLFALSTIVALAGCGDDSTTTDSGTGADTGAPTDSGGGTDGGGGTDTGVETDGGGADTGTATDAGGGTDTGTATDAGGGTDTGMAASGDCINAADNAVTAATDIAADAEACGRAGGCLGGRECVIDCMRDDVGVTMACAVCFGDVADCTRSNCALRCFDSSSAGCISCRADNGCTSAFETCSGLPGS